MWVKETLEAGITEQYGLYLVWEGAEGTKVM